MLPHLVLPSPFFSETEGHRNGGSRHSGSFATTSSPESESDPLLKGREAIDRYVKTVESIFANIRHHKRMNRFTLRGQVKVAAQWRLYCLVHHIEKIDTQAMRSG